MAMFTTPELRTALDEASNDVERLAAMLTLAHGLFESDPDQALRLANEGLELAERLSDDRAAALAMRTIGRIHKHVGDYHSALDVLRDASLRYERLGDRADVALTLNLIGQAHQEIGEYSQASEKIESAIAIFEELGDRSNAAKMTNSRATLYHRQGDYAKALELLQSAREVYEELGDRGAVATNSINMGLVYKNLGEKTKALEHYLLAQRLHDECGNSFGIATATSNIGNLYRSLGEHAKALEYMQSALRLFEDAGHRLGVANATCNIGSVYWNLGHQAMALEQYQSALELFEKLGARHGAANATMSTGNVFLTLADYPRALEQFQLALALYEELGALRGIAQTTGHIGTVYAETEFEERNTLVAEEHFLRAIAVGTEIGDKDIMQSYHARLAEIYKERGRWQAAHEHLTRSHELKEELSTVELQKKVDQIEHLRQIAEFEKRVALERAQEQAERATLGFRAELLVAQVDRQRAELAAQAMQVAKQTEMLGVFRNDLRAIIRDERDPGAIVKKVNERLKQLPCEAIDWTKFDEEFQQTYPEFQSKVLQRYPELTGMEMKVCALLKLKLTSADIGKLLCLSERSIEGHRLRIRRKMALGQGEDVHTALAEI